MVRLAALAWATAAITGSASAAPEVDVNGILDIIRAIQQAVDCQSCHAALAPLQTLARKGDETFVSAITNICTVFQIEDPDVCAGAIKDQAPILAHDLRKIDVGGETATKMCDAVFGLCQPPPVNELPVKFPKSAPDTPQTFTSTGRTPFKVAHFSDVHIDRQYTVGAEVNCTKPICCRHYDDQESKKGHNIKVEARHHGERNCDSPPSLADSMLSAVQEAAPDAMFSLFTGDVAEAAVWLLDQNEVTKDLQEFNHQMASRLGFPVFGVIGNHDSAPVNNFPRSTTEAPNVQWVFDVQSQGWRKWINSTSAYQLVHRSGSYATVVPGTKLKIISINTNYWYKQNFWLYDSDEQQPDPNGILAFMVQELQAAEDAGQRVWIIGHSPVGKGDIMWDQSNYYDQIVQRYKNTIAGQFFGHTHSDELQIAYSDYKNRTAENAVSVGLVAPALTPRSGNPAFKVYEVDPDTYEVMDAKSYFTNMSAPGFRKQPKWSLFYSARESYGPLVDLPASAPLSPAFWHNLTALMARNDTLFRLYQHRKNGGVRRRPCRGECKEKTLCQMQSMRSEDDCNTVTPGVPGLHGAQEVMDMGMVPHALDRSHRDRARCEVTGLSGILKAFLGKTRRAGFQRELCEWTQDAEGCTA
ncbi:sphingomyelin phosphodiesterase [Gloeophyllum trabeum ATCC 11539]|uniref:Sphingomyelin phosphodiesterase n=1 Tax=Gloeophyllum trabeum (strain ATCC 11539 / FP-39264 / Madison 617) TaxID=670483 RepID=S7PY65_GLOTA|nr:sphingomyelin phosphodiesterase [Gloeophyllum trabeum ATCC 11539]EPQ52297.1 sphingomyelin phosphodiesterase [Gloeophyllum trabeum ATCC 11539]